MKKINYSLISVIRLIWKSKLLKTMRLALFVIVVSAVQISAATTYSQETRLSLSLKNTSIRSALEQIEDQTDFYFIYNAKAVDVDKKVNVVFDNKSIAEILDKLFEGTSAVYKIDRRQIAISTNPAITGVQQNKSVSGKVTDSSGVPLPGVTVAIKNTTQGTITDVDGTYSLRNVPDDGALVFSFVGMKTQEILINGQSTINASMKDETIGIEEVVAVGYGTQKRVNLTGAVSSVNFENQAFSSRALSNVSSALAGMTSGVNVTQTSGLPSDDAARIRIRGIGSLNASQEPLVLIDGQVGNLNTISPNDVASISILKDAASAAIYGSRASNGVILVTTKSGTYNKGKITFSYSGRTGVGKPMKTHEVINNTADHMMLINLAQKNSGLNPPYSQVQIDEWREKSKTDPIGYPNTDWWKALTKDNVKMNHHLSARGGNEKLNFFTSVGYYSDNGLIPNTAYERWNFRNNMTFKVTDWLELGNIFTITTSEQDPSTDNNIFGFWRATTPGMVPKYNGKYGGAQTPAGETGANNPLRAAELPVGEDNQNNYTVKFFGTLTPFKGFSLTASYFSEVTNNEGWGSGEQKPMWNFRDETIVRSFEPRLDISTFYNKTQRHVYDFYSSYETMLNRHTFRILVGFNQEYFKSNNFNANKRDLLGLNTPVLDAAPSDPTAGGNASDFAIRSLFGRFNYNFGEKYLFEANLRHDGSSKFSPDNRWGLFPSFSTAWRVSEEPFWDSLKDKIDNFKFRASWGKLGNSGIGNYEWQSVYVAADHSFNGSVVQGLRYNAIANEILTWESTNSLNIGLDFNILRNFVIDLNYYDKKTDGILSNIPIPYVNGGITAPRVNAAEVKNSGFESELRYQNSHGDLTISVAANFSYNKNKIIKYKGDFIEPRGNFQAWTEGHPIGIYWIREVDHIVQDQSEIDALVADGYTFNPSTPGPGDFLYKNTGNDKKIDNDDRVLKGNPIPLYSFGGDLTLKYKGFDLYLLLDGVAGWDKYLKGDLFSTNRVIIGYLAPEYYLNSWTSENTNTNVPRLYTNNQKNNQESDFFLHDAGYVKIKTIQLGYTLPARIFDRFKFNNLRVYVNLENFFTFTSYPGQDPENNDISYPLSKTASLGINLSF